MRSENEQCQKPEIFLAKHWLILIRASRSRDPGHLSVCLCVLASFVPVGRLPASGLSLGILPLGHNGVSRDAHKEAVASSSATASFPRSSGFFGGAPGV